MNKYISYDEIDRIRFLDFDCNCGLEHHMPTQDIYVGENLLDRLPEMIARKGLGSKCVLVSDNNTYDVAGRRVNELLEKAGYKVTLCVITREGEMLPDETACGEVLLAIAPDTEFLLCVGSGSIMDITRLNAVRTGIPFVSVGTAPSMDGFTSVVAPLVYHRVKIHRAAVCPEIVVCDLSIMSRAPMFLIASGVGDVLGKYIAIADWRLGNVINGEVFCNACAGMVMEAVRLLIDNMSAICERSVEGIRVLTEALLISSMTILIIGHTRAVASIEHNIAQYWEMKLIQKGEATPHHGASVGVATKLVLPIYKRFINEDLSKLDLDRIKERRISREQRIHNVRYTYGVEGGNDIIRENPEDFLTWDEQKRRIETARLRFDEIKSILRELPDERDIDHILCLLEGDRSPEEEGVDEELLNLSMHGTKDYRTRYSIFKLLDECGLLDIYLKDYQFEFPKADV